MSQGRVGHQADGALRLDPDGMKAIDVHLKSPFGIIVGPVAWLNSLLFALIREVPGGSFHACARFSKINVKKVLKAIQ